MSHSTKWGETATEAERLVPLHISADTPLTEISVYGGDYKLLGGGLQTFDHQVRPGIYKIRYRAGTTVLDRLLTIKDDSEGEIIEGPAIEFTTAAPLTRTRDYDANRADDASRLISGQPTVLGRGARVVIMALSDDRLPKRLSTAIRMASGEPEVSPAAVELRTARLSDNAFGCHLEVNPGFYQLDLGPQGKLRMNLALHAVAGWQIQVFVRVSVLGENALAFDLNSVSVFYRPAGVEFNPSETELRWTELARMMLADRDNIRSLPATNFAISYCATHPMLALYLAHCYAYLDTYNDDVSKLHRKLERSLPTHTDVRILTSNEKSLRRWLRNRSYDLPPMLQNSWEMMVEASYADRELIPYGSMSFAVSETFCSCSPWLLWQLGSPDSIQSRFTKFDLQKWDLESTFKSIVSRLPPEARLDRVDNLDDRENARRELSRVADQLDLPRTERELLDYAVWTVELTSKLSSQELVRRKLSTSEEIRHQLIAEFKLPNAVLSMRLGLLHQKTKMLLRNR